jgi:hypothetical protein
MASPNVRAEIEALAKGLSDLCWHVSVREDETGPYVLAIGLNDVKSLELRGTGELYLLELWYGTTAEERVVERLQLRTSTETTDRARAWLQSDAI